MEARSAFSLQGPHADLPSQVPVSPQGPVPVFASMEAQSLDVGQGRAPKSYFLPPQGSIWVSKQQAGQHSWGTGSVYSHQSSHSLDIDLVARLSFMVPDHCVSPLLDWKYHLDGPIHIGSWVEGAETGSSHHLTGVHHGVIERCFLF